MTKAPSAPVKSAEKATDHFLKNLTPKFFWMDLEMTGLDHEKHVILEVAAVVTDLEMNTLEQYSEIIVQPADKLMEMEPIVRQMHEKSGLLAKLPMGKPLAEVDQAIAKLLDRHFTKKEQICVCGNSVHNDKRFIDAYMPHLSKRLHYRIVDVSSLKEIFKRKYQLAFKKKNAHEALKDVFESIAELKFYLSFIQIPKPPEQET
jgi:oligoribonuclease